MNQCGEKPVQQISGLAIDGPSSADIDIIVILIAVLAFCGDDSKEVWVVCLHHAVREGAYDSVIVEPRLSVRRLQKRRTSSLCMSSICSSKAGALIVDITTNYGIA